jgi:phage baseplate assembly protein W
MTRAFLGTGWKFPIRVAPGGGLQYSSEEQNVEESMYILLATSPMERQMRPQFGCGLRDLVFEPNHPATRGAVAHHVREALTAYEPRVDVLDVRVDATPEQPNLLLIRVDYRIRSTNSYHNFVYPFFVREGAGE